MTKTAPSSTTKTAAKVVSERTGIPLETVQIVLDYFTQEVVRCVTSEIPFNFVNVGTFYHVYVPKNNPRLTAFNNDCKYLVEGKVYRYLRFRVNKNVENRINGWVTDLGLSNNIDRKGFMRLKLKPDEITKVRKQKLLDEQRKLGFRTELLFDEEDMPRHDQVVRDELEKAPSVRQMLEQLGSNIPLD